jgi:Uma2 family endonuclease
MSPVSLVEFDRMGERGDFDQPSPSRYELIRGELRFKPAHSPAHEHTLDLLNYWSFANTDESKVRVRNQNSISLPEQVSIPKPDLAWVREKRYWSERPNADDVFLIIEVADFSLEYDQNTKAGLYAQAGIPDYWIVDILNWAVEVHRDSVDETWQSIRRYDREDSLSPLCFPELKLAVGDLFSL